MAKELMRTDVSDTPEVLRLAEEVFNAANSPGC